MERGRFGAPITTNLPASSGSAVEITAADDAKVVAIAISVAADARIRFGAAPADDDYWVIRGTPTQIEVPCVGGTLGSLFVIADADAAETNGLSYAPIYGVEG